MTAKISPLPWHLLDGGPPHTNICNAVGTLIATVYPDHHNRFGMPPEFVLRSYADADATAAFVIRAVNSHGDLYAALEEVRESLAYLGERSPAIAKTHWFDLVKIENALAKARGEPK